MAVHIHGLHEYACQQMKQKNRRVRKAMKTLLKRWILFLLIGFLSFPLSLKAEENTSSSAGEITLVFSKADTVFHLYRIGNITEKYQAVFTEEYQDLAYDLSDSDQWERIVTVLSERIPEEKKKEDYAIELKNHKGSIANVQRGVYLVIGDVRREEDTTITPVPFLLSLPEWDGNKYTDDLWIDFVKYTSQKDTVYYRLVKKWEKDSEEKRPKEIKADLYHGKEKVRTVTLNKDNQWTYCWKEEKKGEEPWSVIENPIPEGYQSQVRKEEGEEIVFEITNTCLPREKAPNTGDDIDPGPYVFVTICALASSALAFAILLEAREEEESPL